MSRPAPQKSPDENLQPVSRAEPTSSPTRSTSQQPTTQVVRDFRRNWPVWMRQLPRIRFPSEPDPALQLLDPAQLNEILQYADPEVAQQIKQDIQFLDYEVLRLFIQRDHEASRQQNRYRLFQISYVLLTSVTSILGILALWALNVSPNLQVVGWFLFLETLIALMATFLATISGREPPYPLWVANRRRAEMLRQEYFRYLMRMSPYDTLSDNTKRRMLVSNRAADINRGIYPDER